MGRRTPIEFADRRARRGSRRAHASEVQAPERVLSATFNPPHSSLGGSRRGIEDVPEAIRQALALCVDRQEADFLRKELPGHVGQSPPGGSLPRGHASHSAKTCLSVSMRTVAGELRAGTSWGVMGPSLQWHLVVARAGSSTSWRASHGPAAADQIPRHSDVTARAQVRRSSKESWRGRKSLRRRARSGGERGPGGTAEATSAGMNTRPLTR